MQNSKKTVEDISSKLEVLKQKFETDDQSLGNQLDGLVHSRYTNYWEYIHLDTLLTLQTPKTEFPDETIFITYNYEKFIFLDNLTKFILLISHFILIWHFLKTTFKSPLL